VKWLVNRPAETFAWTGLSAFAVSIVQVEQSRSVPAIFGVMVDFIAAVSMGRR
jgi:hypothetical protein